jgi:hypothetical protein
VKSQCFSDFIFKFDGMERHTVLLAASMEYDSAYASGGAYPRCPLYLDGRDLSVVAAARPQGCRHRAAVCGMRVYRPRAARADLPRVRVGPCRAGSNRHRRSAPPRTPGAIDSMVDVLR